MHLLIAGFGIWAMTFYEKWAVQKNLPEADKIKFNFFLTLIIQFAFGGLFSTFFIFYMRSSSLTQNWFFLLILLALLFGNEIWKKHYERLTFQISVLFVSFYLFLIFLLPVLFHRLGADLFILSGIISLALAFVFLVPIRRGAQEKFEASHNFLRASLLGIFVLMNVLYFANIIPPIPLSIKDSGVYHQITKINSGDLTTPAIYEAKGEETSWFDRFTRYPVFHSRVGESVYAFSAIFSPINFATQIIHQWQYYDEVKKVWVDKNKVTLPITGGRAEGFRTYSVSRSLVPGLWRVRVETPAGQILGNINFQVEISTSTPNFISETL
jgi:hypothetical protein